MSTEANVVIATETKKEKAPRKPTLPAKYNKFLAFGVWFSDQIVEKGLLDGANREAIHNALQVFSSLDEQTAFYDDFLKTQVSPTLKSVRKMVQKHNRPPRAPRAKKVKVDSTEDIAPVVASEEKKKRGGGRKKKEVVVSEADAVVNQLVEAANTPTAPVAPATEAEEPVKKEKKPRAKKVKADA
jgi:hypothetical protein